MASQPQACGILPAVPLPAPVMSSDPERGVRRCAVVLFESRESLAFDLHSLLQGGAGLAVTLEWFALAPHLGTGVGVSPAEREVLGRIGETLWQPYEAVHAIHPAGVVEGLLAKGLLVTNDGSHAGHYQADEKVRAQHWNPLSAVTHAFSRWDEVNAGDAARASGLKTIRDMVERFGATPPQFHARSNAEQRVALPAPEKTALDALLEQRVTCRNFDASRALDAATLSRVLHRVFGAQAQWEAAPDSFVVKKTSPSGGGLHATEAYLLVRHVDGVAPGLYHYHAGDHALEPIDLDAPDTLGERALRFVAGQHWFAGAPVQVVLAPRFRRSFWKYRNHAKAYRALILDAGHLSQTLYLTATEFGLGAFITAAINEVEIERAFGLDPLEEGPLAVCGFGWRGDVRETVEFDPLNAVWAQASGEPTPAPQAPTPD